MGFEKSINIIGIYQSSKSLEKSTIEELKHDFDNVVSHIGLPTQIAPELIFKRSNTINDVLREIEALDDAMIIVGNNGRHIRSNF